MATSRTDPLAVVLRDYGRNPLPADPVVQRAGKLLDDAADRVGADIVRQCLDRITADQLREILNTLRPPGGRFVFWESLSDSRIQCRQKIIKLLYPHPEDPPDWERWEIKEVEIMV